MVDLGESPLYGVRVLGLRGCACSGALWNEKIMIQGLPNNVQFLLGDPTEWDN